MFQRVAKESSEQEEKESEGEGPQKAFSSRAIKATNSSGVRPLNDAKNSENKALILTVRPLFVDEWQI